MSQTSRTPIPTDLPPPTWYQRITISLCRTSVDRTGSPAATTPSSTPLTACSAPGIVGASVATAAPPLATHCAMPAANFEPPPAVPVGGAAAPPSRPSPIAVRYDDRRWCRAEALGLVLGGRARHAIDSPSADCERPITAAAHIVTRTRTLDLFSTILGERPGVQSLSSGEPSTVATSQRHPLPSTLPAPVTPPTFRPTHRWPRNTVCRKHAILTSFRVSNITNSADVTPRIRYPHSGHLASRDIQERNQSR